MTEIDRETVELARWYAKKTPKQRQLLCEYIDVLAAGQDTAEVEAKVKAEWVAAGQVQL